MKVLLIGASGYIGEVITERLLAGGHTVTDLSVSEQEARQLCNAGVQVTRGSAEDLRPLGRLVQEADAVVYESEAVILQATQNKQDPAAVDAALLNALLDAAKGSGKPFLYTSGVAFVGDTKGKVVDESAHVDEKGPLAWRYVHERQVLESRDVKGVVIRPPFMHGRAGGGAMLKNMLQSAKAKGATMLIGDGQNRWSTVHVDDLADLYVRALEKVPAGQAFFAASEEQVALKDVAEAVSHAMGSGGKVASMPVEQAAQALGPVAAMNTFNVLVSGEKARTQLGWKPSHPSLLDDLKSGSYHQRAALVQKPGDRKHVVMPGEMYTFMARNADTQGAYALIQVTIGPDGGPPAHFHDEVEESFYVLEGGLDFTVGEKTHHVTQGDYVNIPRGTVHHFHNPTDKLARIATLVVPGGMDDFFDEACEPSDGKDSSIPPSSALPGSPAIKKMQQIGPRYGITFLPPPAKKA